MLSRCFGLAKAMLLGNVSAKITKRMEKEWKKKIKPLRI
jgi:hypothetical protein